MSEKFEKAFDQAKEAAKRAIEAGKEKAPEIAKAVKDTATKGKDFVADTSEAVYKETVKKIDKNGNGEIDVEDIIMISLEVPGIKINRADFLKKELGKICDEETLAIAIEQTPLKAGIETNQLDEISKDIIQFETNCVSGISAALGMPGGLAVIATIPTDIAQYYGYMLRTAQKLMYLYGFPEIDVEGKDTGLDSATINTLTLCLGVMYGVAGAAGAINKMAVALGEGVSKKLIQAALTKGTIYPIVKEVAKWFNVKMTKEVFAGFFKKSIPVVGGVVGAGITYATFKPCCNKLRDALKETALANPNYVPSKDDIIDFDEELEMQ